MASGRKPRCASHQEALKYLNIWRVQSEKMQDAARHRHELLLLRPVSCAFDQVAVRKFVQARRRITS